MHLAISKNFNLWWYWVSKISSSVFSGAYQPRCNASSSCLLEVFYFAMCLSKLLPFNSECEMYNEVVVQKLMFLCTTFCSCKRFFRIFFDYIVSKARMNIFVVACITVSSVIRTSSLCTWATLVLAWTTYFIFATLFLWAVQKSVRFVPR